MSATFDFERMLGTVLEASGPTVAPEGVVDAALASARSVGQRHRATVLDRRLWPPRTISLGNPAVRRMATIAIVALLLAAMAAAALSIGSRLLRPTTPVWLRTGSLNLARDDSAMVVMLADGRVLAMGGRPSLTGPSSRSAEVYDPESNSWSPVGDMVQARSYGTATLLPDGRVLVVGGGAAGSASSVTAELFDPGTGRWTATGDMVLPHSQHAAILLSSGEVLVAGGTIGPDGEEPLLTTELYQPATGTWRATGPMIVWRASPTITLLQDGTVLVVEGFAEGRPRSAELYDPARGTWSMPGPLTYDRADDQSATLLPNGKVLVVGGDRSMPELYDPATRSFTAITPLPQAQRWHTATLLPDGRVLLAGGGYGSTEPLTVAVLYDPEDGSWTPTAPLVEARMGGKAVLLLDGSVLTVGGVGIGERPLASVERFAPRPWSLFGGD